MRPLLRESQRVHQCRQRGRLMPTTGVVHEEAGNWRRPVLQDPDKPTLCNVPCDLLFISESEAHSSERRLNHQVGIVDYERAIHADRDRLSSLLELPSIWTARKTQGYAPMIIEILWLLRNASRREIARRSHHRQSQFRRDAQRDHILLNVLAELNTGVELACNKVYGASDGDNIEKDVRVGLGECRQPRQQYHRRSRPGHYNSKAPGRSVTNASGFVQGTINLLKRRRQIFQKSGPCSGRRDTLGGSRKKLQLESLLKSADRVAQGGLRHPQLCCSPCKASFTRDDCKRGEFAQFVSHDL